MKRDLLSVTDLAPEEVDELLHSALALKKRKPRQPILRGKVLALVFEKPSLRTRVSFDVAMYQLGGTSLYLSPAEVGLGKREPIPDVARVLSRYVDAIAARTFSHTDAELLARYASVPVINALSDLEHPCQALSDLLTIYEKKGKLQGLILAYLGDSNNVAHSLLLAASMSGMHFKIASPRGYEPQAEIVEKAKKLAGRSGAVLQFLEEPRQAVEGADVIYTDVWTSMGQEAESEKRRLAFRGYQVTPQLLAWAKADAIFLHPLPAHHGEEVAPGLLDLPQSAVFDQAENRLHLQKALLVKLLSAEGEDEPAHRGYNR